MRRSCPDLTAASQTNRRQNLGSGIFKKYKTCYCLTFTASATLTILPLATLPPVICYYYYIDCYRLSIAVLRTTTDFLYTSYSIISFLILAHCALYNPDKSHQLITHVTNHIHTHAFSHKKIDTFVAHQNSIIFSFPTRPFRVSFLVACGCTYRSIPFSLF